MQPVSLAGWIDQDIDLLPLSPAPLILVVTLMEAMDEISHRGKEKPSTCSTLAFYSPGHLSGSTRCISSCKNLREGGC